MSVSNDESVNHKICPTWSSDMVEVMLHVMSIELKGGWATKANYPTLLTTQVNKGECCGDNLVNIHIWLDGWIGFSWALVNHGVPIKGTCAYPEWSSPFVVYISMQWNM